MAGRNIAIKNRRRNSRYSAMRGHDDVFVYLIACGQHRKIGVSATVEHRLRALQGACPVLLELEHAAGPITKEDGYELEKETHKFLEQRRERGEWFLCSRIEALKALAQSGNKILTARGEAARPLSPCLQGPLE